MAMYHRLANSHGITVSLTELALFSWSHEQSGKSHGKWPCREKQPTVPAAEAAQLSYHGRHNLLVSPTRNSRGSP